MKNNRHEQEIDIQSPLEETQKLSSSQKTSTSSEQSQISNMRENLTVPVFFNTCFDKTTLKNLIAWFLDQYGQKVTVDLVETLKQVGFHQATQAGVSLGVDDLLIPPQKGQYLSQAFLKKQTVIQSLETGNVTSVEKSQRLIDTWNQTSETLRHSAVQNFRVTNPVNPVYMMAFSGARGNISQVRQLVGMRGLMADPQGAILEFPIQSNFREGLTVSEYLISCFGARKGLVDTALRTATSGYLTRRLVDAVQHVVVQISDCQTQKGILLKGAKLEQRLIGRVLLADVAIESPPSQNMKHFGTSVKKNTLISPFIAHQLVSKHTEIRVRSPLTCETEKSVCQLCYGLDLGQGKLVSLGEAVGIIAAQSIGEPGTQLTMRTFHTGGVGVFSEQAMKPFMAPFSGKVEFIDPLPGRFVRTPHGNIVYLLKHKTSNPSQPLLRLSSVSKELPKMGSFLPQKGDSFFGPESHYDILQGDVPAGSLVWVKQGEYVKTGQLLIQASRLETTAQEMPESSHPVVSPISGEIVFERMPVRFIKKTKQSKIQKKNQKEDEEIKPIIPVLFRLGKFWIFSSSLQSETRIAEAFFRKGDLLSSETPLQQYDLHLATSGQFKRVGSSAVLGYTPVELQFTKLSYSQRGYFFQLQENSGPKKALFKGQSTVVFYTKNENQLSLNWYSSVQPVSLNSCGYSFLLSREKADISQFKTGIPKSDFQFTLDVSNFGKEGLHGKKINAHSVPNFGTKFGKRNLSKSDFLWAGSQVFNPTSFTQKELSRARIEPKFFEKSTFFLPKTGIFSTNHTSSQKGSFSLARTLSKEPFWNEVNWVRQTKVSKTFRKNPFSKSGTAIYSQNFSGFGAGNDRDLNRTQSYELLDNRTKSRDIFSTFTEIGLKKSQYLLHDFEQFKVIQHQISWFLVPKRVLCFRKGYKSQVILEPGKLFDTFQFPNSFVSVRLVQTEKIGVIKPKKRKNVFYSTADILDFRFFVTQTFKNSYLKLQTDTNLSEVRKTSLGELDVQITDFSFYQKPEKELVFALKEKQHLVTMVAFQKLDYCLSLENKVLKQQWLELSNKVKISPVINSPLFTKQRKTKFEKTIKPTIEFQRIVPEKTGWFSSCQRLQIKINFKSHQDLSSHSNKACSLNLVDEFSTKLPLSPFFTGKKTEFSKQDIPKLQLFLCQKIHLETVKNYPLQTFTHGWVLPEWRFTKAFRKASQTGEFRAIQHKERNSQTCLSFVQNDDLQSFNLPILEGKLESLGSPNFSNRDKSLVGTDVRWGHELFSGWAIPESGRLVKRTEKSVTVRKGIPFLASVRGLVHTTNFDLVEKNDLLVTLRSRRLQTEDIVQGIPKIEQLFEARETRGGEIIPNNMHLLLRRFFEKTFHLFPLPQAIEISLGYIQNFLVQTIRDAYSTQGVEIAEKHIEIVVRQMTARVRILDGGHTGLLSGELIQRHLLEKVNQKLIEEGAIPATYEPAILGITKSVLQSESFLLAASFQQVSRVLVRSALAKKTDFLRGLHENLLVGQVIPAGTGTISLPNTGEGNEEPSSFMSLNTSEENVENTVTTGNTNAFEVTSLKDPSKFSESEENSV